MGTEPTDLLLVSLLFFLLLLSLFLFLAFAFFFFLLFLLSLFLLLLLEGGQSLFDDVVVETKLGRDKPWREQSGLTSSFFFRRSSSSLSFS